MPRNSAASTASDMLHGLKSRLGFSREEDDFSSYDAAFDDYDDFDDDGYSSRYDDEYAGYGADYDENAPVGAYRPVTTRRESSSKFGRGDSSPNLVSIDDVKAHTQVPDTLMRDPLDSRSSARASRANRTTNRNLIGPSGPAPSSPAYTASLRESASRSEGLNSLYESSEGISNSAGSASSSSRSASSSNVNSDRSSYDPYEAYSSTTPASHAPARSLNVIKPVAYGDVERVAKALKAGDVVVLAMRSTPDDLSKRVLDFSFGVASALDANVECPGEKVFAIARGTGLSSDEKATLRNRGVL